MAVWHPKLLTYVSALHYDWQQAQGQLWGEGPVHMPGTIALFTGIDARVQCILTYIGSEPDTLYRKTPAGTWEGGRVPKDLRASLKRHPA
jgi:hypothetical protein